jgi:large subunit ribosomal protein L18e
MKKTDMQLQSLIRELKMASSKENVGIWRAVATDLERPTRNRRAVNLSKISRVANDNETVVVPGKVLASGELNRKITVAAFKFSRQALDKISRSGKAISIAELLRENPKGRNTRIIG